MIWLGEPGYRHCARVGARFFLDYDKIDLLSFKFQMEDYIHSEI